MTPQPTTTQPRNGRRSGALRAGTRAARGAGVRRRALVAALGLAVLAAVVPVTAAHADQPPDLPDFPGDLANPTENPEPPTPPVDNPSPSGDSIPAPQRIDAGFGGVATGSHQAAGVALIAVAILLGLLVAVIARRQRAEAGSSR
jgi:hypothetical protein